MSKQECPNINKFIIPVAVIFQDLPYGENSFF